MNYFAVASWGQCKCRVSECSECTVLLMEPSELHTHERSRGEELLHHLYHFLKWGRWRRRSVRIHINFNASKRLDLPCKKKVEALCVLTGISGGWIWILIINVEVWKAVHFRHLRANTQTSRTFLTHGPPGCIHRPSQSDIRCLSHCCQAAVSYLRCACRKHEKKRKNKKRQSWNVGDQKFSPWKNDTGAFERGVCV